jgi:ABC-type transporter Mla subunit MlaD
MKKFESLTAAKEAFTALCAKITAAVSIEPPKSLDAAKTLVQGLAEGLTAAREYAEGAVSLAEDAAQLLATAQTDLAAAVARAESAETNATDLKTKLNVATGTVTTLTAEVGTLKAEAKTAEQRAAAICAAAGVDPVELEQNGTEAGTLTEQYNAIKDPAAKDAFLTKHKAAIFKEQTKKKG